MNGIEVTVNINLNGEKVAGITTGSRQQKRCRPETRGARSHRKKNSASP